jgi:phosphohistidine phosphatase
VKLHLVRHAIAEEPRRGLSDEARRVTPDGEKRMRRAVAGLAAIGVELDVVLTSPLRRARETAAILAGGLGGVAVETLDALAPDGEPRAILRAIEERQSLDSIALVGHEPVLGRLAARLLGGGSAGAGFPFKKGAVARLEWPSAGTPAALEWFLPPRFLRRLGEDD